MMNKVITLIISVLFLSTAGYSQLHDGINVRKLEKKAEYLMAQELFSEAQGIYEQLIQENPKNEDYVFNLGFCKFSTSVDKNAAMEHFDHIVNNYKLSSEQGDYTLAAYFYLAKSYHELYMFDEATAMYNEMLTMGMSPEGNKMVQHEIKKANDAKKLFFNPVPMIATRLGVINSEYDDHTPIPTADESKVFFTSKRTGGLTEDKADDGKIFEDIWVYDKTKGTWAKPTNLNQPVNALGHDATCGLSPDGKLLFIYRATKRRPGDIYISKESGGNWSEPEMLSRKINKRRTAERHASISPDGKTLYFSSNRRKGKGGRDIWMSKKGDNGKWGKPKNFELNTKFDEESPYMMPDGKTMYFSSKGYNGMGGYDIFKSKLENGKWSTPENIGFPVNTVTDDVFYFPLPNEKKAYFTRRNSEKADIYIAYLYDAEDNNLLVKGLVKDNKEYAAQFPITDLKGDTAFYDNRKLVGKKRMIALSDSVFLAEKSDNLVNDSIYFVPQSEVIQVIDVENGNALDVYETNSHKGDYMFVLLPGKDYKVLYDAPDHVFDTKNITAKKTTTSKEIYYDAILVKIETGETEKTKNTPYDSGSSDFNDFTKQEISLIENCLKTYPNLYVNFSTEDYLNDATEIAKERKKKILDYFKDKGYDESRVYFDLSPRDIDQDFVEYTIYDEETLEKAKEDKKDRVKENEVVVVTEPVDKTKVTIEFENVLFAFDKSHVGNSSDVSLSKLADFLRDNPKTKVEIMGYADAVGSASYNLKLSKKRAVAVEKYLSSKGVKAEQMTVVGYGEANPVALNKTKTGEWFKASQDYNRRVEFKVVLQSEKILEIIQLKNVPAEYRVSTYIENYKGQ